MQVFLSRFKPICLQLVLWAVLCFVQTSAWAQAIDWPTSERAGWVVREVAALNAVAPEASIAQVSSGQLGAFVPVTRQMLDAKPWGSTNWLRLHLVARPGDGSGWAHSRMVLGFGKPDIDEITVYVPASPPTGNAHTLPTPQALGWHIQRAGDTVAQSQWTADIQAPIPRFVLPSAELVRAAGDKGIMVYLRVSNGRLISPLPEWCTTEEALSSNGLALLLHGLCSGLIAMAFISALVVWRVQNDLLYGLYAAYALMVLLANMAQTGLAHWLLWPVGGAWPGRAGLFFVILARCAQVYFCRHLLRRTRSDVQMGLTCKIMLLLALPLELLLLLSPIHNTELQQNVFYVICGYYVIASALCIRWCWLSARAGHVLSKAWLVVSLPLYALMIWSLLDDTRWVQTSSLLHLTLTVTVAVDVAGMGLVLQWFARKEYAATERAKALATRDPLTGFATAEVFRSRLQRGWKYYLNSGHDVAVVYVKLMAVGDNPLRTELMLSRSVRILRAVTRSYDIVGRLDGHLLALLLPGLSLGDDITQRLSRIVAQGLMPDPSDPRTTVLQFRIAATSFKHYAKDIKTLDLELRALLAQPSGWGSRPIRYLDNLGIQTKAANALDNMALEDLWSKALAAEERDGNVSPKPA